jgi:ribosomal protein S18 acetylase RimI-like enzyme
MDPAIRKALPGDLGPLQEIARRTISGSYRSFLGDATVDSFLDGGLSDRYLEDHLDSCSVLFLGSRIAGFCVCQSDLIDLMMIDLVLHRRGLGTVLLAYCEELLLQRFDEIRLESFEGNIGANAFYRDRGWSKAGEIRDAGTGAMKWLFTKRRPDAPG